VFRYRRRVQFAETDMAGIVHFSAYFKYMEEAEHALWRAAGLSIASAGEATGWPRVAASFDFRAALRFEDEFEVTVTLDAVTSRTIRYGFGITREATAIGAGSITIAHVSKAPDGAMKAIHLPADVLERLRGVIAA
jgi:YbgC/YbaW family acyl-CoA thioester hydrolase